MHVHVRARHHHAVGVRHLDARADGAGGAVDRVVDEDNLAVARPLAVRERGGGGRIAVLLHAAQGRDVVLHRLELHPQRIELADGDQEVLAGHVGAGVDVRRAGAARHRTGDAREGEVEVRLVQRGALGIERGFLGAHVRQHLVERLLRDGGHLHQRAVACHHVAVVAEVRFHHGDVRLRLLHRHLVGTRVDGIEELPLGHLLAVLEALRIDPAAGARVDLDGADAHGEARVVAVHRDVADGGLDGAHGCGRHAGGSIGRAGASGGQRDGRERSGRERGSQEGQGGAVLSHGVFRVLGLRQPFVGAAAGLLGARKSFAVGVGLKRFTSSTADGMGVFSQPPPSER